MKTAACFIFLMLTCLPGHGAGKLQIPAKSELAHLKNALQDSNAYKTELVISEFYKKGEKQFSEKLRFYYANILICFSQNHSYLGCFTELKKRVPLLFNTKTKLDITPADQKILSDIYVKLQESGKYHLLHLIAVGLKNAENVGCAIHTCGMDKILNTAIASYDDGTFIFFANKLNYDQLNEAKIIYYYYTMLKNRKDKRCLDLDNYLELVRS